jgi:hypothetical protein
LCPWPMYHFTSKSSSFQHFTTHFKDPQWFQCVPRIEDHYPTLLLSLTSTSLCFCLQSFIHWVNQKLLTDPLLGVQDSGN